MGVWRVGLKKMRGLKKFNINGQVRHNRGVDLKWVFVWGNPFQTNFGDIKDT